MLVLFTRLYRDVRSTEHKKTTKFVVENKKFQNRNFTRVGS